MFLAGGGEENEQTKRKKIHLKFSKFLFTKSQRWNKKMAAHIHRPILKLWEYSIYPKCVLKADCKRTPPGRPSSTWRALRAPALNSIGHGLIEKKFFGRCKLWTYKLQINEPIFFPETWQFSLHKGTWSIHQKCGLKRDGHVNLAVAFFLIQGIWRKECRD